MLCVWYTSTQFSSFKRGSLQRLSCRSRSNNLCDRSVYCAQSAVLLGAGSLLRMGFWKTPALLHCQLWVQDPWCRNLRFLLQISSSCDLWQLAGLLFLFTYSKYLQSTQTRNMSSNKQIPAGLDGHCASFCTVGKNKFYPAGCSLQVHQNHHSPTCLHGSGVFHHLYFHPDLL